MDWKEKLTIFFIFFVLFCLFGSFSSRVQIPDEEYVIRVAQNLVEGKPLDLPDEFPYRHKGVTEAGKDGKRYSTYPIGQSLIIAPVYWLSKKLNVLLSPFNGKSKESYIKWANKVEYETTRYLYLIPAFFTALTCLVFYLFSFALGRKRSTSFYMTLIFAFATITWPYSKFLLSESVQAFFLIFAVYLIFIQKNEKRFSRFLTAVAGFSFGFLAIIKPTYLILFVPLGAYWAYKNLDRKRTIISSLIFLGLFTAVFSAQLWYNSLRFSDTTNFGYSRGHFSSPFYVGLFGLLLSPGKSFFLYSPVAFLFLFAIKNLYKSLREAALLFISIIVIMIFVYANWNVWSGDMCWGPRFLVPLVPFFLLPVGTLLEKLLEQRNRLKIALASILLIFSVWIQIPAVGVHYLDYLNYFKSYVSPIPPNNMEVNFRGIQGKMNLRDNYLDYQFIPEFSPVLGQWWVLKTLLYNDKRSFFDTPWKGLGFNKYHNGIPIKTEFDLWTVNLLINSFKTKNFSNTFWIFIMFILAFSVFLTYFINPAVTQGWQKTREYKDLRKEAGPSAK